MKAVVFALGVMWLATGCSASKPPAAKEWFHDIAAESGLAFHHANGAKGRFNMPEIMGSGCALLDYDNDGDLDVFLIQGSPEGGSNRLFRNDNLHFTDVTKQAGLERSSVGMGVATGDFNNDGYIDLVVTAFGANALYRNNGDGTFTDVTAGSPEIALKDRWSTSAAFFDYDRDGFQDLVILNYVDYSYATNKSCYAPTGELDYCTPRVYQALSSHLFHNEKGKSFVEAKGAGLNGAVGPGLGVIPLDANHDGWLDLFVANDSMANHLWINRKNGTFEESALQYGVAYGDEGLAKAGMGVAAGDYDNDGVEDLLVLNLMREGATLFHGQGGDKGYADVAQASGIHAATLPWTGFGVAWRDFDGDGLPDLFIANGAVTRREEQRGQAFPYVERNLVMRQVANGRFEEVPNPTPGVSRGAAFGDIDNDGDVDILINVNGGAPRLLRNDTPRKNWVGLEAGREFEGAEVELKASGMPVQHQWLRTSGSYLSASDRRLVFGLGDHEGTVASVTIRPLQGKPVSVQKIAPNRFTKVP